MSSACVCHINVNDCDWCKENKKGADDMKTKFEMKREEIKKAYPNLGEYTQLVMASGRSLTHINKSVMAEMSEFEATTFEESREMYCEAEVEAWGR